MSFDTIERMKGQEILKKAIEKAQKNGYRPLMGRTPLTGEKGRRT